MSYANMDGVPTQTEGVSGVLAADWNTYVRDNFDALKFGHLRVADDSARNALNVAEGTMVYQLDNQKVWVYSGSAWVEIHDLDNVGGIASTNPGHLTLTTVQKNALTGITTGTMVYDSTLGLFQVWDGSAWVLDFEQLIMQNDALSIAAGATYDVSWASTGARFGRVVFSLGSNVSGGGPAGTVSFNFLNTSGSPLTAAAYTTNWMYLGGATHSGNTLAGQTKVDIRTGSLTNTKRTRFEINVDGESTSSSTYPVMRVMEQVGHEHYLITSAYVAGSTPVGGIRITNNASFATVTGSVRVYVS